MQRVEYEVMFLKKQKKKELISMLLDILVANTIKKAKVMKMQENLHNNCFKKAKD